MSVKNSFGKIKLVDTGTEFNLSINGTVVAVITYNGDMTLGAIAGTPVHDLYAIGVRADGFCFVNSDGASPDAIFYSKNTQAQEIYQTSEGGFEVVGVKSYIKFPSMTTTQRDAITEAAGMVIWNLTDTKLQVCTAASTWVDLH